MLEYDEDDEDTEMDETPEEPHTGNFDGEDAVLEEDEEQVEDSAIPQPAQEVSVSQDLEAEHNSRAGDPLQRWDNTVEQDENVKLADGDRSNPEQDVSIEESTYEEESIDRELSLEPEAGELEEEAEEEEIIDRELSREPDEAEVDEVGDDPPRLSPQVEVPVSGDAALSPLLGERWNQPMISSDFLDTIATSVPQQEEVVAQHGADELMVDVDDDASGSEEM